MVRVMLMLILGNIKSDMIMIMKDVMMMTRMNIITRTNMMTRTNMTKRTNIKTRTITRMRMNIMMELELVDPRLEKERFLSLQKHLRSFISE